MSGLKISIIVNDPAIVSVLEAKKGRGERTIFVNEALQFYVNNVMEKVDNATNLTEIKQMLVQLMDMYSKGGGTPQNQLPPATEEQTEDDLISRMLADSIDNFP